MKILVILSLLVVTLFSTGCIGGSAQIVPKEANLLGIANIQADSYTPTGKATLSLSSDELFPRKNYGGSKTTLLWGLITLKDY